MGNDGHIEIVMSFWNSHGVKSSILLDPEEYFDPLEDWESRFECDSTPKHLEMEDYLPEDAGEVVSIEFSISDSLSGKAYNLRKTKWGGNWLTFGVDSIGGRATFTEVILELCETSGRSTQVLKFNSTPDDLKIVMHLATTTSDSGEYDSRSLI